MKRPPTRILLTGMLAGDPYQGGATWAVLQYALGLERLGYELAVLEPVDELDPQRIAYFDAVVRRFGLEGRAALVTRGERPPIKLRADVLLNISGLLRDEAVLSPIPIRVYIDLDPAFNQLWHQQGIDVGFEGHTHHVTVGGAIGRPGCSVPTAGYAWIPTLPPVVLDQWPSGRPVAVDAFTTVGNWRSYGPVEHHGVRYGQRAHSLRRLLNLPELTGERFSLALAIDPREARDLEALAQHGFELLDPREVAGTPDLYRDFVIGSRAELGVAKEGYALSRCGWFSDRSACYLAAGRPVVAQATGFDAFLPAGAGLLSFDTLDEAVAAVEELRRDYARHARAARAIAEEYLESGQVLTRLLRGVDALPGRRPLSLSQPSDEELVAALDHDATAVRRRPSAYRSSFSIVELEVEVGDGSRRLLVAKDLSRSSHTSMGPWPKPEFLDDPLREIETYRSVLAREKLGTPAFHGALVERERSRYWLLIEKVAGVELYQVGELDRWQTVMRWLAAFHDHFAGRELPPSLLRYDRRFLSLWAERAERIAGVETDDYAEVADRLATLQPTLVHGEFYPANILVAGDRVSPIDWEMAGLGPAVIDVAALTTGWGRAEQELLEETYLLAATGTPGRERFAQDVDCARIHLALRWLGWGRDWTPPPEHAHDWRAELANACERVGL
jgi:hypothetical protein